MNHDDAIKTTDRDDACDLQQWIDELLRSSDAAELEATPSTLHSAATTSINDLRRREKRRRSLLVLTTAATVAAIVAWPNAPVLRREATREGLTPLVHHTPKATATVDNPSPGPFLQGRGIAAAVFETSSDAIAIPQASNDPQVSIVKLYPTTITKRRWHRELAIRTIFSE